MIFECRKCHQELEDFCFAKEHKSKTGYFSVCKGCQKIYYEGRKEYLKQWKKDHPLQVKLASRKWAKSEAGKKAACRGTLKWQKNHKEEANKKSKKWNKSHDYQRLYYRELKKDPVRYAKRLAYQREYHRKRKENEEKTV
jgi:hypothetical protein